MVESIFDKHNNWRFCKHHNIYGFPFLVMVFKKNGSVSRFDRELIARAVHGGEVYHGGGTAAKHTTAATNT